MEVFVVGPQDDDVDIEEQYFKACQQMKQVLDKLGYHCVCEFPNELFFALSNYEQKILLKGMNDWSYLLLFYVAEGGSLQKTENVIRYWVSRMNVSISSIFMEQIRDGDIVEIYGSDSKRLFFNPELFKYSSYSADVMFSHQWWSLYEREEEISELIQDYAYKFFIGEQQVPLKPEIPKHIVAERASAKRYASEIEYKCLAPVMAGGEMVGIASLESFRLLDL